MESGGGQRRRTSIYHGQRGSGIQIQLGMQCIITDNESQSQVTMSGGHSHNSVTPPARCCLDGVVTMLVRSRHRHDHFVPSWLLLSSRHAEWTPRRRQTRHTDWCLDITSMIRNWIMECCWRWSIEFHWIDDDCRKFDDPSRYNISMFIVSFSEHGIICPHKS